MIYGAVDYASGRIIQTLSDQKGETSFMAFLDDLAQALPADEPIVVVLDNASYHKSAAVRAWWRQHADRFQPAWLPPRLLLTR